MHSLHVMSRWPIGLRSVESPQMDQELFRRKAAHWHMGLALNSGTCRLDMRLLKPSVPRNHGEALNEAHASTVPQH